MIRIAIITLMSGSSWGGSEYLWATVAEKALSQGHEVFISLYDWSVNHPIVTRLNNQGAYLLPRSKFPKSGSHLRRLTKKLLRYIPFLSFLQKSDFKFIQDYSLDVILISQGSSYDLVFFPELIQILNSQSTPYLILNQYNSEITYLDDQARVIAKNIFSKAKTVAFVSKQNLKLAEHHLAHSFSNAIVVQNPVNLKETDRVPWPQQEVFSFGCVARLESNIKGQDILFQTLSLPHWHNRNWECKLYGSGPDQNYLKSLASHYGISSRIKFMGHVNEVRSIWAENHILVLPSRAEGTPLSLVEAMLCGRPAVVTDVGGNTEWIEEGQTGFIAETATVPSLNTALNRAWEVRETWENIGRQAHLIASSKFSPSPGQEMLNILLKTLENN